MGIGICLFLHWKMGVWSLGSWDLYQKESGNGNGIGVLSAYQWDQDTRKWDLEKNGCCEMGLVTPIQDSLYPVAKQRPHKLILILNTTVGQHCFEFA